jgi:hypothetical protein
VSRREKGLVRDPHAAHRRRLVGWLVSAQPVRMQRRNDLAASRRQMARTVMAKHGMTALCRFRRRTAGQACHHRRSSVSSR